MPSLAELPTPDQLTSAPEWGSLSAGDRVNVVDQWALQTRAAHPWDAEQTKAIDGALDDFHSKAAETGMEQTKRFGGTMVKSGITSLAALPFMPLKLGYEEGKAMGVLAGDESPEDKAAVLAQVAPDALKLGQGYERTVEGAKSFARQNNPFGKKDEEWQSSLDALKNDVLSRKLPDDPSQLYDALKKHGLRIAQATAKLHGENTTDYLPFEYQDIEENGVKRAFTDALTGKRMEGFHDVPDDVHRRQGVTFKNQSRSLVGSPENLGLLMQFSATRNPKYFDALVQRLGRSRTRQQQDVDTASLDSQRKEDAMDVAVRNIFSLGGLAPDAGEHMVKEVQGLATSPVDAATAAFSFGLGRAALRAAETSLVKAAGKVALGTGAEFLQGAGSALGDESVPTVGNVVEQGLMEAGAGGVIEATGAATQGVIDKATGERATTPIPAQPSAAPGVLSQIAANAGREENTLPVAATEAPAVVAPSEAAPPVEASAPVTGNGFTNTAIPPGSAQGGFIALPPEVGRALTTGTPAPPGEQTSIYYQGEGAFRVQRPDLRAILKGGLLPKQLNEQLTQSGNERAAVNQSAAQISQDLDASINDYAKRTGQPLQAVYDLVNSALEDPAVLVTIPDPGMKEAVRRTRNFIDDLSTATANITGGQLGSKILGNLGSWMRRSYAAFDPASGWNYDALQKAADKGKVIAGKSAASILQNARTYLQGQYPAYNRGQIEALMRKLTDRETWGAVMSGDSSKVTPDVTSFIKRKDIAPELRALMGEEKNPIKRVISSASFQSQFIAQHEMQKNMRRVGLAMGLFSDTQTGVYTEQIGGDAGPLNKRWAGFGVLYTTPEMLAALQNARGVMTGTDLGGKFLNAVKFIGGEAKLNKVALNPDSWMVNLLGNLTGLVSSGDAFLIKGWQNMWKSAELMASGRIQKSQAMGTASGLLQDAKREMLSRLTAAGVASGGLEYQDIEQNMDNTVLQFIQQSEAGNRTSGAVRGALLGRALGAPLGVTGKAAGATIGAVTGGVVGGKRILNAHKAVAEWMLSKPDNWGKIAVFLSNYETHLEAGMTPQAAFELASEKTLNTMPDYSKLPALARELSRYGATGSFIAFQFEVYRNAFHNYRYAAQELASKNPALMKRGAARLFGASLMMSLGGWVGLSSLGFNRGAPDDKDEAYRRALARPWDRFSNLVYDKLDSKGATYTNTSYLIPQATIWELFRAASEGKTFEEALLNVAAQAKDQFINGSVHVDPILEAVMNQRKFGGKVTPETGLRGYYDRLEHILKATATPGYADKAERYERAVAGRSKGDRTFSIEEENKRLLGIRQASYTHEQRMVDRLYQFSDRLRDARDVAKRAWSDNGKASPDTIGRMEQENGLKRANDEIAKITEDYAAWKKDLGLLGISHGTIERVQKDRSVYVRPKRLKIRREGPETVK